MDMSSNNTILLFLLSTVVFFTGPSFLHAETDIRLCSDVINGNAEGIIQRADKGFDLNVPQCLDGMTPLMIAARYNMIDTAKLLIDRGADVNARGEGGRTALMAAADSGHVGMVEFLLDRGAGMDITDIDGRTVLIQVMESRGTDLKALFGSTETSVTASTDSKKKTYFGKADEAKQKSTFMNISEKIKSAKRLKEHLRIARILVKQGAAINIQDGRSETALSLALANGHTEMVKLLIESGADVGIVNDDGETFLMMATDKGYADIAKLLIGKHCDINAGDSEGDTALIKAAVRGHAEIVKLLLSSGADINAAGYNGMTAFIRTVEREDVEMVKLLLKAGADINVVDEDGRTAAFIASESGNHAITALIEKKARK
jgi:ankyrin repeat protein